jgi:dihydrodipicolinate synthase/N-acetylneuraminate lyase
MTAGSLELKGVWVDALIPMNTDLSIHHAKLATHIRTLGVRGIQGVILFGPAGEGASFNASERIDAIQQLLSHGISGKDIVLHAGFPSFSDSVQLIHQAHQLGLRGCIVTPPPSDEEPTLEGLAQFFSQVATRTSGLTPHLYLGTPFRTGLPDLKPQVVNEVLSQHPGVYAGLIDQTRNSSHVLDSIRLYASKLPVYPNNELQASALSKLGLHTCLSSFANLIPTVITSLVSPTVGTKVSVAGNAIGIDDSPLIQLAHLVNDLPEVPALKFLMSVQYRDSDWQRVRPPASALLAQSQEKILKEFKKYFPNGIKP